MIPLIITFNLPRWLETALPIISIILTFIFVVLTMFEFAKLFEPTETFIPQIERLSTGDMTKNKVSQLESIALGQKLPPNRVQFRHSYNVDMY